MAQDTLITVLRGKIPVELPFKALVGKYADRLLKAYGGNVTISDAKLTDKLTEDEYRELAYKYPYLAPVGNLAPEPPLLTIKAAESLGEGRSETLGSVEQQLKNMKPIESNGIQVEYLAGGDLAVNLGAQFDGASETRIEVKQAEPKRRGRKPNQTEA
jgi:hypothetical protein